MMHLDEQDETERRTMSKRKFTPAGESREEAQGYMTILIKGKQRRVKRIDVEEFIRKNADPVWLNQNELWEEMESDMRHAVSENNKLVIDGLNNSIFTTQYQLVIT